MIAYLIDTKGDRVNSYSRTKRLKEDIQIFRCPFVACCIANKSVVFVGLFVHFTTENLDFKLDCNTILPVTQDTRQPVSRELKCNQRYQGFPLDQIVGV